MARISGLVINKETARAIMKSPEVRADLVSRAERIKRAASEKSRSGRAEYMVSTYDGEVSAHAVVFTANNAAKHSNAKHDSLKRSMAAGKD